MKKVKSIYVVSIVFFLWFWIHIQNVVGNVSSSWFDYINFRKSDENHENESIDSQVDSDQLSLQSDCGNETSESYAIQNLTHLVKLTNDQRIVWSQFKSLVLFHCFTCSLLEINLVFLLKNILKVELSFSSKYFERLGYFSHGISTPKQMTEIAFSFLHNGHQNFTWVLWTVN